MNHRYKTFFRKYILSRLFWIYGGVIKKYTLFRYHCYKRRHRVVSVLGIVVIFFGFLIAGSIPFSYERVFGYIRLQLAIHSLPECQNGIDDDEDGYTDYPHDNDCSDGVDDTENTQNPPTVVCFATNTQ